MRRMAPTWSSGQDLLFVTVSTMSLRTGRVFRAASGWSSKACGQVSGRGSLSVARSCDSRGQAPPHLEQLNERRPVLEMYECSDLVRVARLEKLLGLLKLRRRGERDVERLEERVDVLQEFLVRLCLRRARRLTATEAEKE